MPPSIDPVDNFFGTGASLIKRVLIAFLAGWLGNLFSRLCASIQDWRDLLDLGSVFSALFGDSGYLEILAFVLWPLIGLHYLAEAPLYALVLIPLLILCIFKIVITDDPILFWSVLIVALLTPGLVFTIGSLWSYIALGFFSIGLGGALWWSLLYDHPEWVDQVRSWLERD